MTLVAEMGNKKVEVESYQNGVVLISNSDMHQLCDELYGKKGCIWVMNIDELEEQSKKENLMNIVFISDIEYYTTPKTVATIGQMSKNTMVVLGMPRKECNCFAEVTIEGDTIHINNRDCNCNQFLKG